MRLLSVRGQLGHGLGLDGGGGGLLPSLSMRPWGRARCWCGASSQRTDDGGGTPQSPPPPPHTPSATPRARRVPSDSVLRPPRRRGIAHCAPSFAAVEDPAVGAAHCTAMRGPRPGRPPSDVVAGAPPPPEVRGLGGDGVREASPAPAPVRRAHRPCAEGRRPHSHAPQTLFSPGPGTGHPHALPPARAPGSPNRHTSSPSDAPPPPSALCLTISAPLHVFGQTNRCRERRPLRTRGGHRLAQPRRHPPAPPFGGGGLGGNVLRGSWACPSGRLCYGSATGRYAAMYHSKVIGALRGLCCVVSVGAPRIPPPPLGRALPLWGGGGGRQDIVCGAPPPAIAPNPRSLSGV